jgi:hypothetical protein
LSRHHFTTKAHARQVVVAWCHDFYNSRRRHSSAALMSPIQYETRCRPTGQKASRPEEAHFSFTNASWARKRC